MTGIVSDVFRVQVLVEKRHGQLWFILCFVAEFIWVLEGLFPNDITSHTMVLNSASIIQQSGWTHKSNTVW